MIIIGGDNEYRDESEEEQVVISRWARRKVASQFDEEYLDGRKSFIFSWNKAHREIHEEALKHYLDPSKKEQKFQYVPKPKPKAKPTPTPDEVWLIFISSYLKSAVFVNGDEVINELREQIFGLFVKEQSHMPVSRNLAVNVILYSWTWANNSFQLLFHRIIR